jgi:hypothetical protein
MFFTTGVHSQLSICTAGHLPSNTNGILNSMHTGHSTHEVQLALESIIVGYGHYGVSYNASALAHGTGLCRCLQDLEGSKSLHTRLSHTCHPPSAAAGKHTTLPPQQDGNFILLQCTQQHRHNSGTTHPTCMVAARYYSQCDVVPHPGWDTALQPDRSDMYE